MPWIFLVSAFTGGSVQVTTQSNQAPSGARRSIRKPVPVTAWTCPHSNPPPTLHLCWKASAGHAADAPVSHLGAQSIPFSRTSMPC